MNRSEVLKSDSLKRRFLKDCSIPINVTDEPYFSERLDVLEITHGAMTKFMKFCECMEQYNTEQEYFEDYTRVKEAAMDRIKSSEGFQRFNDEVFEPINEQFQYPKRDLYKDYNKGNSFISIDMKKANFSALNHYDPGIFADDLGEESETWEYFISQFTDNEHIINSKYIRQVILGNCNPKRQIKYEDYLMHVLAKYLSDTYKGLGFYSVKNDEILINTISFMKPEIRRVPLGEFIKTIENEPHGIGKLVKVDMFYLYSIECGWVRDYYGEDEQIEFKCMDADTFHQYVKHYYEMPIGEDDLVFKHNGKLAKFLEEVENPWEQ